MSILLFYYYFMFNNDFTKSMTYFIKIKLCFQTILIILSRPDLFWWIMMNDRETKRTRGEKKKKGEGRREAHGVEPRLRYSR